MFGDVDVGLDQAMAAVSGRFGGLNISREAMVKIIEKRGANIDSADGVPVLDDREDPNGAEWF